MKPTLFFLSSLAAILVLCTLPTSARAATAALSANGHWEGEITLPTAPLAMRVDLDQKQDKSWNGTIDIPAQGLRGFKLGNVSVTGSSVAFGMIGIPGDPKFDGKLSTDGTAIHGDFTQAGQRFPFELARKNKPVEETAQTPARGIPGKGLAGRWQGSLKPSPITELRLSLHITNNPPGKLSGVMFSLDQGNVPMSITNLTLSGETVHFEVNSVRGSYDGKTSVDGSEILGDWKQSGQSLPLVFKRLPQPTTPGKPQEPKKT